MEAEKWLLLSVLVGRTAICLRPYPGPILMQRELSLPQKNNCVISGAVRFCLVGHKCCLRDLMDWVELLGMYYSLQPNLEFWHHSTVAAFTQ